MNEAQKRADWPGHVRRYAGPVYWALALAGLACRTEATVSSAASARSEAPYVCDEAHDYSAFEASSTLAGVGSQVPRREQTKEQAESLTPGDPVWQLVEKPEVRCSTDGFLELRYASAGTAGFAAARNRMTVTIAPGTRLLDPEAYARMRALAEATDEALSLLRTKSCSESGAPCDLQRNPDPLRFPGARAQYTLGSEFKQFGQRAWFWQLVRDERQVLRAIFSTTDGRFDVEVLVEVMDADGGFGALGLVPELLSDEYDKRLRRDGGAAGGGSHG